MSYGMARRFSKNKDKFGDGEIEGVVAPETAAHAAGTSALLPMLTLGIPGSPTAAVLLGGLLIWGLQPGPLLFVEKKEFVWGLIASMYLGNIVGLIIVLTTVPWWAAILRIPFSIIAPVIVVICAIGAYTVHNNMFDVVMMMVFGVVGYVFKKLKYPLAPLVLALVLGDMAETAFRQSMLLSAGSLTIFYANPLVGSIVTLALVLLCWPLIGKVISRARRSRRDAEAGVTPRRGIVLRAKRTYADRSAACGRVTMLAGASHRSALAYGGVAMNVRDIMTAEVIVASPDDDLMRAAQLMESNDFGSLPIGDGGRLVGMLTDRDITIRGVARGLGPNAKVREVMTTDIECVRDTDSLAEAAARMEDMQVRRLPVVDDNDKLVGIVSLGDLAQSEPDDAGDALQGISQPSH